MLVIPTSEQRSRFRELENTINKGKKTFVEVGIALAEIRDTKLYKIDYETFSDYCEKKWGWTRQRAYQLIESSEVAKSLETNDAMSNKFDNSAHASALASVPEAKRPQVLKAAAESGKVTAKSIKEAAKQIAKPVEVEVEPETEVPVDPDEENLNSALHHLDEAWRRMEMLTQANSVGSILNKMDLMSGRAVELKKELEKRA